MKVLKNVHTGLGPILIEMDSSFPINKRWKEFRGPKPLNPIKGFPCVETFIRKMTEDFPDKVRRVEIDLLWLD